MPGPIQPPGLPLAGGATSQPFTIEDFGGVDTKARRPAISPKDFYWLENWITIGPGNLRTIYDRDSTPIYTASNPRTIIYYMFYNIGSSRYCAVFLDNGTAVQVNTVTLATTTITASANTFYTSGTLPHAVQYQSKYLAILSKVGTNAYWIWDGALLFTAGTLAPQVTINASGLNYSSAPTVTAYGGTGSGATFTATVSNGSVTDIKVTAPGSGWLINELVTLVITGGGSGDQARATATVTTASGGVASATVTAGGTNYTKPVVTFAGGGGAGAAAFVSGASNGVVTQITITDPGSGYTSNPTLTIADSGGGAGAGATGVCQIRRGQVTAITVNSGGSGYTGVPSIVISTPNDFGFPEIQAVAFATVVAGAVTAITLTNKGLGYLSATVDVQGGNGAAAASIKLMPFGISGTSIETYQDRIWAADDTKYSYTGPSSVFDFSGAGGGGSKPVTDSFLREKVIRMIQANGFLYRMGDSSINVISNVQTSNSGVTSFNDANVDPQIGASWRDSVVAFGRALVFANPTGVYAIYGGAAEKVSGPLDGLFAAASFNTNQAGKTPTAAVASIFGLRVYCIEFTTTDPYSNTLRDIIAMWDGQHWFIGSQSLATQALAGQEVSSQLTAYGASTTAIYRLFTTASASLNKILQTKLASNPTYMIEDQVMRVYYIAQAESGLSGTLNIAVENQAGPGQVNSRPIVGGLLTLAGAGGVPLAFVTDGGSFTRASIGSYYGPTGQLTFAGVNVPRKTWDPNNLGAAPTYLLESAATNLVRGSEDFATPGNWVPSSDLTATVGAGTAPNGSVAAFLLTDNNTASDSFVISVAIAVANDSASRAFSVYLKQGTAAVTRISLSYSGGATPVVYNADITWATVTVTGGTITPVSGGWYRCTVTGANNATGNLTLNAVIRPAGGSSFAPTGSVYAWGAQVEAGTTPTSYFATTNLAGTRAADVNGGGLPGAVALNFSARGLIVDGYDESQFGQLIGATVTTMVPDLTLISLSILLRPYAPDG